ncbi:MAG: type II toxin-antitoxin system VapC family toxin [Anaerolineales bacterium]|nr:type II toxin-antitoxin system VapC family toxin [Anaerolineales bacterium]
MKLFVDTWGWLTLRDKRESQHQAVTRFYQQFLQQNGRVYTTDYVLDETYTLLFKRLPFVHAEASVLLLDQAIARKQIQLVWITPERFGRTKALRLKLQDKPDISFTDLSSMIVMEELAITDILTGDAHFTYVGMGFQRMP